MIVGKATDYITRQAEAGKPFFTYVALSQVHPPEKAHPDFDQTSPQRLGMYADLMAEMDHRVGQIVDCVEQAGIADNTLIVFSSDNATALMNLDMTGGSNGPFRGGFMTPPVEGSMRVPAIVRWTGKVPAGVVTEEMLSAHDWYKTFAALAGASGKVPADRPMDGIDASAFLFGQSQETGRGNVLFFGPDGSLMSSKWHNVRTILRYCEGADQPILEPQFPMVYDLGSDPASTTTCSNANSTWAGWLASPSVTSPSTTKASPSSPTSSPARNSTGTRPCPVRPEGLGAARDNATVLVLLNCQVSKSVCGPILLTPR
jgi:arylsulfatase A-like enzyme